MKKFDFTIIGSGVGGLSIAIKLASFFPNKKIALICKSTVGNCSTQFAQGGIAVVQNFVSDSIEKHINDTLECGKGMCNRKTVEMVIQSAPSALQELLDWGMEIDRVNGCAPHLGKEGGHSENRIVHYKDQSGAELMRTLMRKANKLDNIHLLEQYFAIDLIVFNKKCCGVSVFDSKCQVIQDIISPYTILASGGIGDVYRRSTNPKGSTGDGIAMAKRAGVTIKNMEFVQFHPTAYYADNDEDVFLISEAVRGAGAILRNERGEAFMERYDKRKELAPRDIVSQSIFEELQKQKNQYVFLDCTSIDSAIVTTHFPMIKDKCSKLGINMLREPIPVAPAQHYCCGGVDVNMCGETSLKNLFACGEVAHTGLHGANRLASNSLLEAIVYSEIIFNYLKQQPSELSEDCLRYPFHLSNSNRIDAAQIAKIRKKIRQLMQENGGVKRNISSMQKALESLSELKREIAQSSAEYDLLVPYYELLNLMEVGELILCQSLSRKKRVGCYWVEN